jgi:hypothetical protein
LANKLPGTAPNKPPVAINAGITPLANLGIALASGNVGAAVGLDGVPNGIRGADDVSSFGAAVSVVYCGIFLLNKPALYLGAVDAMK